MTQRWWAPESPHLGPDEQDLALLVPVNDARHDLGAALLALHRVGAAACEEVALQAIPDEHSLIQALSVARTAFAAPLVQSVSKSLGEGPYAGLLVRDVIDDAEQGAMSVFKTLCSKGVPAPLSAQRAGMVYGVPEDALGTFLNIAGELRAHPAALSDAADRALFTAVEKIATEEFEAREQPWEPVSKAPEDDEPLRVTERRTLAPEPRTMADDPTTPFYDARDVAGRFARGRQAGPEVAPTREQREARQTREVRQTRQTRQPRESREARSAPAAKTGRTAGRKAGRATRKAGRDVMRLSKSRAERTEAERRELEIPGPDFSSGDFMEHMESPAGPFEQLDMPIAISMSPQDWGGTQEQLAYDEDGRKVFRIGHMIEGRDVNYFGNAPTLDQDTHRTNMRQLVQQQIQAAKDQFPHAEILMPVTAVIYDDEVEHLDPEARRDYIFGARYDAVAEHVRQLYGDDVYLPEIQQQIQDVIARRMPSNRLPDNSGEVYVYQPRNTADAIAPRINVVELVFDSGVRGRDDGQGKNVDLSLDANQLMRLEVGPPDIIYDPAIGAYRTRYYVNPDVSKADDPDTPYFDNRDQGGRFAVGERRRLATERTMAEEPTPTRSSPERQTREGRQVRQTRQARQAFTPQGRAAGRSAGRPAGREAGRSTRRVLAERIVELEDLEHAHRMEPKPQGVKDYALYADGRYVVMTSDELESILEEGIDLGDRQKALMTRASKQAMGYTTGGRHADYTMRELTDKQIMAMDDSEGIPGAYKVLRNAGLTLDPLDSEYSQKIYDHIDSLFREHPEVQQIMVHYDEDGSISFHGNKYGEYHEPVILIEVEEGFDPDSIHVLTYRDSIKAEELTPDFDDPITGLKALRQQLASQEYDSGDYAYDHLLPLKVTRPHVELYTLSNSTGETEDEE